jgi:biotin transport system substrate-specific component
MSSIAITTKQRRVLADEIPRSLLADTALVIGAACLVGLLAQVSFPLGFTPVPVTGQTLGVLLAGAALGWRRASASMSLYVLAGLAGVPWFEHHASGYPSVTFGYLLGFVVAGSAIGWLAARGSDRTMVRALLSMLLGEVLLFGIGVPWLAVALHVSLLKAISLGLTPFLWGEAIKITLAGTALPASWRLVQRSTKQ